MVYRAHKRRLTHAHVHEAVHDESIQHYQSSFPPRWTTPPCQTMLHLPPCRLWGACCWAQSLPATVIKEALSRRMAAFFCHHSLSRAATPLGLRLAIAWKTYLAFRPFPWPLTTTCPRAIARRLLPHCPPQLRPGRAAACLPKPTAWLASPATMAMALAAASVTAAATTVRWPPPPPLPKCWTRLAWISSCGARSGRTQKTRAPKASCICWSETRHWSPGCNHVEAACKIRSPRFVSMGSTGPCPCACKSQYGGTFV